MEATCPHCAHRFETQVSPELKNACPRCMAEFLLGESGTLKNATPANVQEAEPPPLQPGARLRGYEIREYLGRGGMGYVYLANQAGLDRLVALKILAPRLAVTPQFAARFDREAKALASLSHPNIVQIHDYGQEGGLYFLVMEYVDGTSLRRILGAQPLSPEAALRYVPQICEALEYAHGAGIVHRDIKPENILIDKRGVLKIADFGLAKMASGEPDGKNRATLSGQVLGTPHYMAPEQVEKTARVDHRADIYSLGVVFYEMLTGELPLGRFPAPSQKVQVDVRFDHVVLKALEKEPERRYQKASEVKDAVTSLSAMPEPKANLARNGPGRAAPRAALSLSRAAFAGWLILAGAFTAALLLAGIDWQRGPAQPAPRPNDPRRVAAIEAQVGVEALAKQVDKIETSLRAAYEAKPNDYPVETLNKLWSIFASNAAISTNMRHSDGVEVKQTLKLDADRAFSVGKALLAANAYPEAQRQFAAAEAGYKGLLALRTDGEELAQLLHSLPIFDSSDEGTDIRAKKVHEAWNLIGKWRYDPAAGEGGRLFAPDSPLRKALVGAHRELGGLKDCRNLKKTANAKRDAVRDVIERGAKLSMQIGDRNPEEPLFVSNFQYAPQALLRDGDEALAQGNACAAAGKYDQATTAYLTALKHFETVLEDDTACLTMRWQVFAAREKVVGLEGSPEFGLAPHNGDEFLTKAHTDHQAGNFEKAKTGYLAAQKEFESTLERAKKNTGPLLTWAKEQYGKKEFEKALKAVEVVLQFGPENTVAAGLIRAITVDKARYDHSVKSGCDYVEHNTATLLPQVQGDLTLLRDVHQNFNAAEDAFDKALLVKPGDPEATKGKLAVQAGRVEAAYQGALGEARAQLSGVTPDAAGRYRLAGPALVKAQVALQRAMTLKKDDPDAKALLEKIAAPQEAALDLGEGVKLELVQVQPGKFSMGSPVRDEAWEPDEGPRHEVAISQPFLIGKYEVTWRQFERFVAATGYKTEAEKTGKAVALSDAGPDGNIAGGNWRSPPFYTTIPGAPVSAVSWKDAREFCLWLGKTAGKTVRLPREAEWEYACRAGTQPPLDPGLGGKDGKNSNGNISGSSEESGRKHPPAPPPNEPAAPKGPVEVGQYPANLFGLHDMLGNVSEWCEDWYGKDYYQTSPVVDPAGPATGELRVVRGGSWFSKASGCRPAARAGVAPGTSDCRIGFRVIVLSGPP